MDYRAKPFPEKVVSKLALMSGRTREDCSVECNNDIQCAGFVRKANLDKDAEGLFFAQCLFCKFMYTFITCFIFFLLYEQEIV